MPVSRSLQSNSVRESLHGASTNLMQVFGAISVPHAVAMGQSRTNNDHGHAHKNLVTGRKSKKTIDSKKRDYLEGMATNLFPELLQSLTVASTGIRAEAQEEHGEVDALAIRDTEEK